MEAGIHELSAGYALDALDPDERRAFEAHLEHCDQCRHELATFWETTEALAVAASGPAPSPGLRGRVLAAARAEPQVVVPFEPRRRLAVPVLGAVAAAAALLALAVGLWASSLSSDLDETRAALARERATAAVLADPGAKTVSLEAGRGEVVVTPDGRAVLVVHGLEEAPAGMAYELWVIEGGTPVAAGLFRGGAAPDVVSLDGRVDPGDVVAVTLEQAAGVSSPTGDPIVASEPA